MIIHNSVGCQYKLEHSLASGTVQGRFSTVLLYVDQVASAVDRTVMPFDPLDGDGYGSSISEHHTNDFHTDGGGILSTRSHAPA